MPSTLGAPKKNFHGLRKRLANIMERLRSIKKRWQRIFDGTLNVKWVRTLCELADGRQV